MELENTKQIQARLGKWYRRSHRKLPWRETDDPYRIWISEVMLQQTQINTVLPYYRAFVHRFPDIERLAGAGLQEVLKAWEGLGYYARARNLHRSAGVILAAHAGKIPDTWGSIRKLPGVGDYIAAAVLSIAFGRPHAVVDGNVKRVLARLFKIDAPANKSASHKIFQKRAEELLDRRHPGLFNQALMELGALCCKPRNPLCDRCPIDAFCEALRDGVVSEYPKRARTPAVPLHHIAVGVILRNGRMLITRRKSEGLLGGLWEFPGGKVGKNERPEAACARELREEVGLDVRIDAHITTVKHAYTHFKIVMDVFSCSYVSGKVTLNGPVDYRWITYDEIDRYPFPKANHKFIPMLGTLA